MQQHFQRSPSDGDSTGGRTTNTFTGPHARAPGSTRRDFLKTVVTSLAGTTCDLSRVATVASSLAGGGPARLANPALFASFVARIITHGCELDTLDDALSSGPASLLATAAGEEVPLDSAEAMFHAYRLAGAAIQEQSNLGLLAALHGTPDATFKVSGKSLPQEVLDAVAHHLRHCDPDCGDFSDIVTDQAYLRERITDAFNVGRSTLSEMADPASWLRTASADIGSPAVNLLRNTLRSQDTRLQLMNNPVFERHVRLIDLVQEAELHAGSGAFDEARYLLQEAQDISLHLGDAIQKDIAAVTERKFARLQGTLSQARKDLNSANETSHSWASLQPPAPASFDLALTYRARTSDVFLVLSPYEGPLCCYQAESNIPWMEHLCTRQQRELCLPFGVLGESHKTTILFIAQGVQRIGGFRELSQARDDQQIQAIFSKLKEHIFLPAVGTEIRLFAACGG